MDRYVYESQGDSSGDDEVLTQHSQTSVVSHDDEGQCRKSLCHFSSTEHNVLTMTKVSEELASVILAQLSTTCVTLN